MLTRVTDTIIEDLINSTCGNGPDPRSRHLLTHSLHELVRVAKAEQLQQMRLDVELAMGAPGERAGSISLTAGCDSGSTGPT
ncbi:hypothetical protein RugamoR64_13580 [Duganella rhizosphaerae]